MMNRQKIIIVLLIIICVFILVSNYSSDDETTTNSEDENSQFVTSDKTIIAGIYRDGSKSWFIDEGLSASIESKALGAFEYIFIDGNESKEDYLQGIDSIIDEEVDGVILCQPYEELSDEIAKRLEEVDIPFVSTNVSMNGKDGKLLAPVIGVDDYALGHMTGDWMANYTIKNGLVDNETVGLIFLKNSELPNMQLRLEGQYERFKEMVPYFDDKQSFFVEYNGGTEDGLNQTLKILYNNLEVTYWLVMTGNDEGAIGAVRALEQLGMDSKAAVVSIGGTLAINEFKKEYSALKASSYYSSSKIGREAAKELFDLIENPMKEYDETYFNAVIITKDNYQEFVEDQ